MYMSMKRVSTRFSLSGKTSINARQMISQAMMMPNIGILNNIHYVNGKTGLELQYQQYGDVNVYAYLGTLHML